MKKLALLLLIIICISCTPDYTIKTGTYKYVILSKFEYYTLRLTNKITSYAVGSEIILNQDSTYRYTTCGNIITGTWFTKKDSLYLRVLSNRWRSDSLNKYGYKGKWPELSPTPFVYKIKNDYIIKIHHWGKDKCMEKLKYVKLDSIK